MAIQKGPFKFSGKFGDAIGYYDGKEQRVKKHGKVDIEVRQHAPQYEETRKNEAEFGVATRAGQLFRQAMMHITQRWTNKHYPPNVMKAVLQILRSDVSHIKGQKTVNSGLKNTESQMIFKRLEIYHKKSYKHYRANLMEATSEPNTWKLNHQFLWSKNDDGEMKSIKLGYLHIDFDAKISKYEEVLTISCKRNEKVEFSEHNIVPSSDVKTPWTFIVMQVWRDGDIYEPTGMLFMNVLQCIENETTEGHGWHDSGVDVLPSDNEQLDIKEKGDASNQIKKAVDENGVNWDVVLDLYFAGEYEALEIAYEEDNDKLIKDTSFRHDVSIGSGERVLKGIGFETSISINGEPVGTGFSIGNYTTYASGDFVVDGNKQVSKHYFMGSERIASRLVGLYIQENEENCPGLDKQMQQWINNLPSIQQEDISNMKRKLRIRYLIFQNEISKTEDCRESGRSSVEGDKQWECFYQNNCKEVLYYYHSDHTVSRFSVIGSSTFLTDALGNRYEFMVYHAKA